MIPRTTIPSALASRIADASEPVFTYVGGRASVGIALACSWAMRQEDPRWDRSMAAGATAGAVIGAVLMLADAALDVR